MSVLVDTRRAQRQDTFDLRNDIHVETGGQRGQNDTPTQVSDEDHSVLEDDSSNEDRDGEYMDEDDASSSLSIPNESIDFDLVYSLHNFAATVEGQASVVKGDSLFLMDDSNSYWWLVRVLTTQEVGYIPAENIETPFERLARLNKHRNVDLASATQEEIHTHVQISRGQHREISPSVLADRRISVKFNDMSGVYTYPPAVWHTDEDDEEWVDDDLDYDPPYVDEVRTEHGDDDGMEPDDGISWEGPAVEDERARATAASSVGRSSTSPVTPTVASNAPASAQQQQGLPVSQSPTNQSTALASTLREQTSRERLYEQQQQQQTQAQAQAQAQPQPQAQTPVQIQVPAQVQNGSISPVSTITPTTPSQRLIDPAVAGEPRKLSLTPSIAKEAARQSILAQQNAMQEENAKRAREEAEAAAREEENARKRTKKDMQPVSSNAIGRVSSNESVRSSTNGKLRKGSPAPPEEDGGKKKKGMFGGLFGRKNKKEKPEGIEAGRNSEESSHGYPSENSQLQQQQPQQQVQQDSRRTNAGSTPTPGQKPVSLQNLSQHTLKMQQKDREQQALYEQYLKSSPATVLEASHGLQSASAVMPNNNNSNNLSPNFRSPGGRPGSLIISPTLDGQGVPELSVIRVFAGPNLHTEATFKTVLLNMSTTSEDLIRQAMQRFRLPAGEHLSDYYLEIKQVEGQSAVLLPSERPLGVFENLVEASQMEVPKVKRSSVGSISSVASNLSMHPAIKKLSMNDFTDDSAVKFYLNRRSSNEEMRRQEQEAEMGDFGEEFGEDGIMTPRISVDEYDDAIPSPVRPGLTLTNASGVNVTAERFSSPSVRFAIQVFILPEDLPDGMVFDPQTEAIVPKSSLRERERAGGGASSGVSQTERKKVLHFPKNTTVAEVIELGLERFGIAEGVVDGGDEVEDKLAKRVSLLRVRYGLAVQVNGQERYLQPSSKILDAFPRPPIFRPVDRRAGEKRRSVDSAMLLNAADDIRPDDPIFILRRAIGFRTSGRMKQPLDEIALEKKRLHRGSLRAEEANKSVQQQQMSRQELIAAQREASREKQRAILSAQTNSERGMDVVLSGNRMLRSIQNAPGDRMRYSYIQDGETIDISDLVEEERQREKQRQGMGPGAEGGGEKDWLESVARNINHEGLGDNLDRVLNRIKGKTAATSGRSLGVPAMSREEKRVSDMSAYSVTSSEGEGAQTQTQPLNQGGTPAVVPAGTRTVTPPRQTIPATEANENPTQPSASTGSGSHSNSSSPIDLITTSSPSTPATTARGATTGGGGTSTGHRTPLVMRDFFGVTDMMAIIEYTANDSMRRKAGAGEGEMDVVDKLLFGPRVNVDELHPRVREMFAGTLKQLEEMDKQLDRALSAVNRGL